MKDITLYRFKRADGGTTVSPSKPDCDHETLHRLIADEGMMLTCDDGNYYPVIDVNLIEGWREIPINDDDEIEKGADGDGS